MTPIIRTHNFRLNFGPLQVMSNIQVVLEVAPGSDGVPGRQIYDVLGGGYYPDYTVFPVVLQPEISVYDPDGFIATGEYHANKDLANASWYFIEDGVETMVTGAISDFQMVTTGDDLGRLKVRRNVLPNKPLTLKFTATYLDPRTGESYEICDTYLLECEIRRLPCTLKLNIPSQVFYNPYKKAEAVKVIHAAIFTGSAPALADHVKCIWQHWDGSSWRSLEYDHRFLFATQSADTMSLTLDQEAMGEDCVMRCIGIAVEDPSDLADADERDAFGERTFRFERRIPDFELEVLDLPYFISPDQKNVYPKAKINWQNFSTNDPCQELSIDWLTGQNKIASDVTYNKVATGENPVIPADKIIDQYGQMVQVSVSDRGAFRHATNGSGQVLTDGQGRVLLIR